MPYVRLSGATLAALWRDGIRAEYEATDEDDFHYARVMCRVWSEGRGFVLIEQDKVPFPGAVQALWDCPHQWCSYRYQIGGREGPDFPCLGCCKFSDELVASQPDLMERAAATNIGLPPGHWRRLDMAVALMCGRRIGDVHWHDGIIGHDHQDISHNPGAH